MNVEQIGHGISEDLINKVRVVTHQFFELPYEEKLKIKITPSAGYRFVPYISNYEPKLVSPIIAILFNLHNEGINIYQHLASL